MRKPNQILSTDEVKRVKDLDIDEDLPFQKRLWKAQKMGRIVWGLIIALGIAGFFGEGPMSQTTDIETSLEVEYEKFAHVNQSDHIKIGLNKEAVVGGKIHLWIDGEFLKENPIQKFSPEPSSSKMEDKRIVYEFDALDSLSKTNIIIELIAQKPGFHSMALGLVGGPELEIKRFFWP